MVRKRPHAGKTRAKPVDPDTLLQRHREYNSETFGCVGVLSQRGEERRESDERQPSGFRRIWPDRHPLRERQRGPRPSGRAGILGKHLSSVPTPSPVPGCWWTAEAARPEALRPEQQWHPSSGFHRGQEKRLPKHCYCVVKVHKSYIHTSIIDRYQQ